MADDPTEPTDPEGTELTAPAGGRDDDSPVADLPDEDVAADDLPDEDVAADDLPDDHISDDDIPDEDSAAEADDPTEQESKKPSAAKTADADGTIVRKRVTSKRVTPKGAAQGVKATRSVPSSSKAGARGDDDFSYSKRYTPPKATYAPGPSPWWVPALMFGLLIVGALVIMLNYMGAFGDAENLRLVIGLAFILGGIITATQYR